VDGKYYREHGGEWTTAMPAGTRPLGIIALATAIPDMRALSSLNLANNDLGTIVGWTHHPDPSRKEEYIFMHSDGRHQKQLPEGEEMGKPEGPIAIADAIPDMRALTKLIFGGDQWYDGQSGATPEPVTLEVGMAEADFSNKGLQAAGAIIVAAWMSHKDNGAMTSLSLASNNLGVEGAKIVAAVLPKCA
jgi:hypothetical protein